VTSDQPAEAREDAASCSISSVVLHTVSCLC
jgi:hypothetical protein